MGGQTRKLKWSLDDLDLSKPIEPLSRFIDDPEKLIDEVFKIAAKYLPKDIVPSSLKDIPTVELKKLCLEQLKKVERETLLSILTDGSNDLNEDAGQSEINLNETKELHESISSGSGQSRVTKDVEIQVEIVHSAVNKEKDDDDHSTDVSSKKIKKSKAESTSSSGAEVEMTEDHDEMGDYDEDPDTLLDQAALEIRELELRAQAIRTLLKKHAEADSSAQSNIESQKESRKRPRTDSSHGESTSAQKDNAQNTSSNVQRVTEQKSKDHEVKPTKVTSRLSRNPVSMVEEDEPEDVASSSTEMRKCVRRKRNDESNIMIQLHNDSDDSIDRELKGE